MSSILKTNHLNTIFMNNSSLYALDSLKKDKKRTRYDQKKISINW